MGRDADLARLTHALSQPPSVLLIEGEAGIGKTRLVQEFLASPAARGRHALSAACLPFRGPFTLGPVVDALQQECRSPAGLQLSALAGALRPLFPEWAADLPPAPEPLDDPGAARHRLFRAVAELLDALRVSVLVVDDAHWADDATLELLLFLVSRRSQPVSLAVAYRPRDVPDDSLLLRFSSHPPASVSLVRIVMAPLSLRSTTDLVSSMLDGQHISAEFASFLQEHTDGIPLMVEESVRLLYDRQDLIYRGHGWERHDLSELHVPATVRDSVLERARRLSPAAQLVLAAAAVLGESTDLATAAKVADIPLPQAKTGVTEAARSGLLSVSGVGQILFTHMLAARAVYEDTPQLERIEFHLRAGLALESASHPPLVELVRHFREAGETSKWCRYGEQVAAIAAVTGDDETAIAVLTDLLTRAQLPGKIRAGLAERLGTVTVTRRSEGREILNQVIQALRVVLDSPDLDRQEQAEIRNRLGRLLFQQGELEAARAELERAIPDLDHDPVEAARAMAFLGWPWSGPWPAHVHLEWLQRSAALPITSISPVDRLALTVNQATALIMLGEESGWSAAAEMPLEAVAAEEKMQVVRGYVNTGNGAILWGRYAEARRRLCAGLDLAVPEHFERLRGALSVALAHLDWLTGSWPGLAERLATLMDSAHTEPKDKLEATLMAGLLEATGSQERAARQSLSRVLELARRQGILDLAMAAAAGVARIALTSGGEGEALEVTEEPVQAIVGKGIWIWGSEIIPARIDALVAAGRSQEAEHLSAEFVQGMSGRDAPAPQASLVLCRAILAESQDDPLRAAALFADAATAYKLLPRPYEAWLARERQAKCLLSGEQTESGLRLLSSVFLGLCELGAQRDAERTVARLRAEGTGPPHPAASGRRGYGNLLSPRELEVVRLVAAGWTNKKIAVALSRSPRTIEGQLHSAMRKLGVSSRTELAVASAGLTS
ncbi:MAG TPA: AAA family ATPase [Streptosporangiaceae bacterium]